MIFTVNEGKNICHYNEDCPPNKYCDRLNRECLNPCDQYNCGANSICHAENHTPRCKCSLGYKENAHGECESTSSNPCLPNPCGVDALCENDNGNPICFCPKGLTGNPFEQCSEWLRDWRITCNCVYFWFCSVPEGDKCQGNPCGDNSGCRVINGHVKCFCLPGYEGNPPQGPCSLPNNPCDPSPCGPHTQCSVLKNDVAKCTCLPGFIESPNTIRGCVPKTDLCQPNPCGYGALCDSNKDPPCYCPGFTVGNPYSSCSGTPYTLDLPWIVGFVSNCLTF